LIHVDVAVSNALAVPGRGIGVDVLGVLTAGGLPMARLLVLGSLSVWLAWRQWWRLFWLVVVGGVLVGPLNDVLKVIFDRPRPDYHGTIEMDGLSYPSGHAAGAAAVATILLVVFWPGLTRSRASGVGRVDGRRRGCGRLHPGRPRRALRLRRARRMVRRHHLDTHTRRRAASLAGLVRVGDR
jgi:membrane-associated phospholipid phosphatase